MSSLLGWFIAIEMLSSSIHKAELIFDSWAKQMIRVCNYFHMNWHFHGHLAVGRPIMRVFTPFGHRGTMMFSERGDSLTSTSLVTHTQPNRELDGSVV